MDKDLETIRKAIDTSKGLNGYLIEALEVWTHQAHIIADAIRYVKMVEQGLPKGCE